MKLIWYHRLICLWLAAFVLLGSSGHVVAEHWCKMKGKSVELLITRKACRKQCQTKPTYSSAETGTVIYKSPCCKDVEQFSRLEPKSLFTVKIFEFNPRIIDGIGQMEPFQFRAILSSTKSIPPALYRVDDPPTRSGRFRLTQQCAWLI